jgi:hypothetical protein
MCKHPPGRAAANESRCIMYNACYISTHTETYAPDLYTPLPCPWCLYLKNQGAPQKKMTEVTCICCSAKKKVVAYSILFLFLFLFLFLSTFSNAFFGRFVTRGVQKHEKNLFWKKPIWAHHKKCGFFFGPFFLFCLMPSRICRTRAHALSATLSS